MEVNTTRDACMLRYCANDEKEKKYIEVCEKVMRMN